MRRVHIPSDREVDRLFQVNAIVVEIPPEFFDAPRCPHCGAILSEIGSQTRDFSKYFWGNGGYCYGDTDSTETEATYCPYCTKDIPDGLLEDNLA